MGQRNRNKSKKKLNFKQDKIYMLPIGGCGQFGANMTFYGYNGRWILVDCGGAFADERLPGVDLVMPNISNIPQEIIDGLEGLLITHAHEDHVGGVRWLWEELNFPVLYASPFATQILKNKFSEMDYKEKQIYKTITPNEPFSFADGDITVTAATVSHSIPEAMSFFIKTPNANLLHSGDWNMDDSPVMQFKTEENTFRELAGEEGVLAYIGDSTNAENEGLSPSEQNAEQGLMECFKDLKGRIIVTLFSSNISRIQSICKAAAATGRSVAASGRSVETMIRTAKSTGYLQDVPDLLSLEDMGFIPDHEQVYIVTGSQGEARAALGKISRGAHRFIKVKSGDAVLFSARKIPGNERAIQDVMNDFLGSGVEVITPKERDIHVSGHPYGGEIDKMLEWVNPRIVIPVHGEKSQISAQARIGEARQKKICIPDNGSLIEIDPESESAKIICDFDCELRPIVFDRMVDPHYRPLKDRRRISFHGCVFISMFVNENSAELEELQMSSIGLLDLQSDQDIQYYEDCMDELEKGFNRLKRNSRCDIDIVEKEMSSVARRFFSKLYGAKPTTEVHVLIG